MTEAHDEADPGPRYDGVARYLAQDFLNSAPGAFFRARALQLMRATPEAAPVEWPATTLGADVAAFFEGEGVLDGQLDADSVQIIDSFMLAHHAGECLLRHVFGIADARATDGAAVAPWLHMVTLQGGSSFRHRVAALRDLRQTDLDSDVGFLFLTGLVEPASTETNDRDGVMEATTFCSSWLREFAKRFLDSARGYNAAKHGLTPLGGPVHLSFHSEESCRDPSSPGDDGGAGFVLLDGPALRTLEHQSTNRGGRAWFEVTRAVDPAALLSMTLIAADLLDWLWAVERGRTTAEPQHALVRVRPLPIDVLGRNPRAWSTVRMPLGLFAAEPDQSEPA